MNKKLYSKSVDDELKKKLTPMQYKVTQENATEKPFENEYWNFDKEGLYVDVCTGEPLFSSKDKYHSSCGWPAFSKPLECSLINEKEDFSSNMHKIEVRSKKRDSHLGHVFNDGPKELGGMRYCINSTALKFIPVEKLREEGYEEFLNIFEKNREK